MSFLHVELQAFLIEHGLDLLVGTTIVLASFSVLLFCTRSVAWKHRLAGTAILSVTAFMAFALAPLPRWTLGQQAASTAPEIAMPVLPIVEPVRGSLSTLQPVVVPPVLIDAPRVGSVGGPEESTPFLVDQSSLPVVSVVAWLLLVGATFFVAQLLLGWMRLLFVLSRSEPALPSLTDLVELPRRTRLRITRAHTQPFCCGLWRGTIVLPVHMAASRAETRFVLLHEIAHLAAGDGRLRTAAALLRPMLFWHPLFWWLQQQLRFHGELLADAAAAQGAVPDYARCMMHWMTVSSSSPSGPLVATVFRKKSELCRRLEIMLQRTKSLSPAPTRRQRRLQSAAAIALVTLSAGVFGVDRAVAQEQGTTDALRAEVAELRATIRELRAELSALRARRRANASTQAERAPAGELPSAENGRTAGSAGAGRRYRVRAGDSLATIAQSVFGSSKHVDRLMRLNPGIEPRHLKVGQVLILEAASPEPAAQASEAVEPQAASRSASSSGPQAGGMSAIATLVTRAIELRGEVEIQAVELEYATNEFEAGRTTDKTIKIAKIRFDTTQRQLRAITRILEGELKKAELQLSHAEQLAKRGFVSAEEVLASKNRVMWIRQGLH
ncbi:MAG: LysM peptidoglycan-binding domain-containing protein [Planctomycetes bacterium]|nr:LysM peptidoglycan-binding domain-containing protein [Planctomycetota bacterium]